MNMRVNQDIKFSYDLVKGSVKDRQQFVSNLNQRFYNRLIPHFKDCKCTVNDIKDTYSKVLQEKKKIRIIPLKGNELMNFDGASDYIYSDTNCIGVTLEIPAKRSKISEKSIVSIMHENTHILETFSNPKHTARTQKLYKDGKYNSQRDNWYENFLYRDEKIKSETEKEKALSEVKLQTEKFLSGKTITDKIDHLQDARYELEQEKNAHAEQLKYAKILQQNDMFVEKDDLIDYDTVYLFTEKIKLLKAMTFDLIAKQRKKFAAKFGK